MKGFTPGSFDRLMDVPVRGATSATVSRMSTEDLKDSVARDLEALLNTRAAIPEDLLDFDAHLQPSTLHYSISKARHAASAGA